MISGAISIGFAFALAIFYSIKPEVMARGGYLLLSFYIAVFLGAALMIIANLVYTTMVNRAWSFYLATVACLLGMIVIWIEMPRLSAMCVRPAPRFPSDGKI